MHWNLAQVRYGHHQCYHIYYYSTPLCRSKRKQLAPNMKDKAKEEERGETNRYRDEAVSTSYNAKAVSTVVPGLGGGKILRAQLPKSVRRVIFFKKNAPAASPPPVPGKDNLSIIAILCICWNFLFKKTSFCPRGAGCPALPRASPTPPREALPPPRCWWCCASWGAPSQSQSYRCGKKNLFFPQKKECFLWRVSWAAAWASLASAAAEATTGGGEADCEGGRGTTTTT